MADIFISYKRTERSLVEKIAKLLRNEKFDVWFDSKLEVGRDEGFQSQIEREVTSAGCVLVCWTPEASKSIWVKAEAMKGMERDAVVPVFLNACALPLPFNALDTADLSDWKGDALAAEWLRILEVIRKKVNAFRADDVEKRRQAAIAYEGIQDKVYPGILKMLVQRVAALHEFDRHHYNDDIKSVIMWLHAIAEKETNYIADGYELAERQPGGSAWYFWENGESVERSAEIASLRGILADIDAVFVKSQKVLEQPAP
ncbi:hypothetical protein BH10BAC2_BH10BAC2_07230 [soil metagenome]